MASIEIQTSGRIDARESAFPMAVQLPSGKILCSFSVGGGADVTGGTECSTSADGGKTWTPSGVILPANSAEGKANFLKLSLAPDGRTIYAYGAELSDNRHDAFGHRPTQALFCRSNDEGGSWSPPTYIPLPAEGASWEVSHGILPLGGGRLLAPAATLPSPERLGEKVLAAFSNDGGRTWPEQSVVFQDPQGRLGFFEHKFAKLPSGRLLATAWTVTLGDYRDQPNSYTFSDDAGRTWRPPLSTGMQGQTLTPIPLSEEKLLVLYNRRYGQQGIMMCLVSLAGGGWSVEYEQVMYDGHAQHERSADVASGIDELAAFAFGFPTAIRLHDGAFLATHWCVEGGVCGIRWTRLKIDGQ